MEQRAHWTVAQRACLDMAWLVFGLPYRLRVEGRESVPTTGGVVVVSNHFSLLDPVFLSMATPRPIRYLVKPLPAGFEPVQYVYDVYECIATGSGRALTHALAESVRAVRDGAGLAIFPEGSLSADGRLGAFQTGAARVALACGCPVVPAWIEGAYAAMPAGRVLPRLGQVTVRFGAPLRLGAPMRLGQAAGHSPRAGELGRATMVLREAVARLAPGQGGAC